MTIRKLHRVGDSAVPLIVVLCLPVVLTDCAAVSSILHLPPLGFQAFADVR